MRTVFATVLLGVWATGAEPTGAGPGFPVVPLDVFIESEMSDVPPTPTRISGDGLPYRNGEGGTTATFDKWGNLIVAFGRPVSFVYEETPQADPPSGWFGNAYISTLPKQPGDGALQNMPVLGTRCIQLNWQFNDPSNRLWWLNGFQRRELPVPYNTSYAVVSRLDVDTWSVEPTRGFDCGGYINPDPVVAGVYTRTTRGKTVITDYGTYSMPFRITLTRQ